MNVELAEGFVVSGGGASRDSAVLIAPNTRPSILGSRVTPPSVIRPITRNAVGPSGRTTYLQGGSRHRARGSQKYRRRSRSRCHFFTRSSVLSLQLLEAEPLDCWCAQSRGLPIDDWETARCWSSGPELPRLVRAGCFASSRALRQPTSTYLLELS